MEFKHPIYTIQWLKSKLDIGETVKYIFFWGHTNNSGSTVDKSCFSQWYESPFMVDNITYKTAEHWMMAHKARLFNNEDIFQKIINCTKPGEAKELGRQVTGYDEEIWNEKKFDIVKAGNIYKFHQNPLLADFLLKTGDRVLVEASPVDMIWGIGLAQDDKDVENVDAWKGQNLLGFALMEARDFLREKAIE